MRHLRSMRLAMRGCIHPSEGEKAKDGKMGVAICEGYIMRGLRGGGGVTGDGREKFIVRVQKVQKVPFGGKPPTFMPGFESLVI